MTLAGLARTSEAAEPRRGIVATAVVHANMATGAKWPPVQSGLLLCDLAAYAIWPPGKRVEMQC